MAQKQKTKIDTIQVSQVGKIREIRKDIATVTGLTRCMNGEVLDIGRNTRGLVIGFHRKEAYVFLLGRAEEAKVGDKVYSQLKPFFIPVGDGVLGRVVDALAQPLDNKGPVVSDEQYPIFRDAPGVLDRVPIRRGFETGLLTIDSTIPIGKGQRELIIGDRQTGKTALCVDSILNQKGKDVICIYCCIGRSFSSLRRVVETLKLRGAMDYTIVAAATASACSGEQYLIPYTACALGEYFMDRGKDVFVVFDDLTKHAWAYRQLSLLLERPPGRECYPGDIFYLHSQLMERAGQLSPDNGGGSMTFFPIVDTLQGDVTGYIPSNLVSMTDGQIYMNLTLFNSGFRPAIDLGLSVSRIGSKVQSAAVKQLSSMLRLQYVQYNELLKQTRFTASASEEMRAKLRPGEILTQLFTQEQDSPYSLAKEILLLYAMRRKVLDPISYEGIERFKREIEDYMRGEHSEAIEALMESRDLKPTVRRGFDAGLKAYFRKLEEEREQAKTKNNFMAVDTEPEVDDQEPATESTEAETEEEEEPVTVDADT